MTSAFMPVFEELDEPECRRLLGTVQIGRIGLSESALPVILPVRFALWRGEVVIAPLAGRELPSTQGDVVVFEVDCYDPSTQGGWVVTVTGRSRQVTDPEEVTELHRFHLAPGMPAPGTSLTAVRMELVRGRRRQPVVAPDEVALAGGPARRTAR
jgi:hypothetical protein